MWTCADKIPLAGMNVEWVLIPAQGICAGFVLRQKESRPGFKSNVIARSKAHATHTNSNLSEVGAADQSSLGGAICLADGPFVATRAVAVAVVAGVSPADAGRPSSTPAPALVQDNCVLRVPPEAFLNFDGGQSCISGAFVAFCNFTALALVSGIRGGVLEKPAVTRFARR
eukprot:1097702-Pleurochrysis_carterae.AAC.14